MSRETDAKNKGAIFASGAGSNARKLLEYFSEGTEFSISLIVCNNPGAGVIGIAKEYGIETLLITKEDFSREDFAKQLLDRGITAIILAGFLWKIPQSLIAAFPERIINIHPALLPGYGGKGMYGAHVHSAVINARERQSGITIHVVDEHYDNGKILFQASVSIAPEDNAETLAAKIHKLEHGHYPIIALSYLSLILNGTVAY